MNILSSIANWKLDAKFDEMDRYFYHIDHVRRIESGTRYFVIGRKGTGKTAISEHIYQNTSYNRFCIKLSFKNFPFNELYSRHDNIYTRPNQFISLWKYLMYCAVCKMMVSNENIDSGIRASLEKIFGATDPSSRLHQSVRRWVASEYKLQFMGTGGAISFEQSDQTWIERLDVLEEVLCTSLDDSDYYILFDELDEDYKHIVLTGKQSDYLDLITSLFKAVQDVNAKLKQYSKNVRPVVFLRDDIYDLILDPDKNKWEDFRIDLDWDAGQIRSLLAFRITRAGNPTAEIMPFNRAWKSILISDTIRAGGGRSKSISIFEFITRATHLRPRDYVRYLQVASERTLEQRPTSTRISPIIIRAVDKGFSNYLRNELVDEMHGLLPDVTEILSVISEIRKWTFSINEFRAQYHSSIESGSVTTKDVDFVLKALFHFSVIGNIVPGGRTFFRYRNKEARFNFNEKIVVHRGLFKALQIY